MPTGSLCAERNAIGTCLATDPSIRRGDMVAMAVLSMSLPSTSRAETTFGDSLIIPSSGLSAQSKVFDTPPSSPGESIVSHFKNGDLCAELPL